LEERQKWKKITSKKRYNSDVVKHQEADLFNGLEINRKSLLANLLRLVNSGLITDDSLEFDSIQDLKNFIEDGMIDEMFYVSGVSLTEDYLEITYYDSLIVGLQLDFTVLKSIKEQDSKLYKLILSFYEYISTSYVIPLIDLNIDAGSVIHEVYQDMHEVQSNNQYTEELYILMKEVDSSNVIRNKIEDVLKLIETKSTFVNSLKTYIVPTDDVIAEEMSSYYEDGGYEIMETLEPETFRRMVDELTEILDNIYMLTSTINDARENNLLH